MSKEKRKGKLKLQEDKENGKGKRKLQGDNEKGKGKRKLQEDNEKENGKRKVQEDKEKGKGKRKLQEDNEKENGKRKLQEEKEKEKGKRKLQEDVGIENIDEIDYFLDPKWVIEKNEALKNWPHRYIGKETLFADEKLLNFEFQKHYMKAVIDDVTVIIGQNVTIESPEDSDDYVGTVLEIFEGIHCEVKKEYCRVRWFYRERDTIIGNLGEKKAKKLWWSESEETQELATINGTCRVARVPMPQESNLVEGVPNFDFFYYQAYSHECTSFYDIPEGADAPFPEEINSQTEKIPPTLKNFEKKESLRNSTRESLREERCRKGKEEQGNLISLSKPNLPKPEKDFSVVDLYSGCGALFTGLQMGASLSGLVFNKKSWSIDFNQEACLSLKHNHPDAEVRNEKAIAFLKLLKIWKCLCDDSKNSIELDFERCVSRSEEGNDGNERDEEEDENGSCEDEVGEDEITEEEDEEKEDEEKEDEVEENKEEEDKEEEEKEEEIEEKDKGKKKTGEEFDVEEIVGIRWNPDLPVPSLEFKVRWENYEEEDDTWLTERNLKKCKDKIDVFIKRAQEAKILPLPGDVDFVCGGPPCQDVSGHNRYRGKEKRLIEDRNQEMVVFLKIVEFLRPKYVLMENVTDLMKWVDGYLAKMVLQKLVNLNYQARTGILVAGSFGVAQFRQRAFFWGALSGNALPQFPLPTHLCAYQKNFVPEKWKNSLVAWEETEKVTEFLEPGLVLGDCMQDFPPVDNDWEQDPVEYLTPPQNAFQLRMRAPKTVFVPSKSGKKVNLKPYTIVHDHIPHCLNYDDHYRVTQIPKEKGASFRDLEGVLSGNKNAVFLDEKKNRSLLATGNPLAPDYAFSFREGKSKKPFGRLSWDETFPTVITRAVPHNQAIVHPEQDRVLTIRECARLQGFPDHYQLFGKVKERYRQVGNAVAVPVSQALGFALGKAANVKVPWAPKIPVFPLPPNFPFHSAPNENN